MCDAVNRAPLFRCEKPGHLPTMGGVSCAECDMIEEGRKRRERINAPILAQLRAIRAALIADWHKPWPGCNFGKAHVGQGIDLAIADLS